VRSIILTPIVDGTAETHYRFLVFGIFLLPVFAGLGAFNTKKYRAALGTGPHFFVNGTNYQVHCISPSF